MFNIRNTAWNSYRSDPHCMPLDDLANLVYNCSDDALTRSTVASATVLALAQIGGPSMLAHPAGYLLVNTGGAANDPIDDVVRKLTGNCNPLASGDSESLERNRKWMIRQVNEMSHAHAADQITNDLVYSRMQAYHQSSLQAFGSARVGAYARRHDKELGWVADTTNHVILRLDSEEDHAGFQQDVQTGATRLMDPMGYGETLILQPKKLSVAGSIPADHLEDALAAGIVGRALPLLFLPHAAGQAIKTPDPLALTMIAVGLETETHAHRHQPVATRPIAIDPWSRGCIARLRQRLAFFPDAYEFFIQCTIRELDEWCERLAYIVTKGECGQGDQGAALYRDLQSLAFHGICIGIDWLGWHGFGFNAGCSRKEAFKILGAVRGEEGATITRRDLLRRLEWLDATKRDEVLERLAHEGLVTLTDTHVSAVTAADYLLSIPARTEIKTPPLQWEQIFKNTAPHATAN